jgi:pimeloyl-ACP methyl ester carboxylesterase
MSVSSRTRRFTLCAAALALLAGACGSDDDSGVTNNGSDRTDTADDVEAPDDSATSDTDAADDTAADDTGAPSGESLIEWTELADGIEEAYLEVPVDYENPAGDTFQLYLARRLADDRDNKIGTLLINPGGPGFGGSDYGLYADQVFSPDLLEQFDILGWDPRGTGFSEPFIDCIDDYDPYFAVADITPDDQAERDEGAAIAEDFADQCATKNADIIQFIGTNNSARDMNSIREALGEATISYLGFSYGSELGATWATLFPETVRAAVLDGAADPNADAVTSGIQQITGFETSLATFLAGCSDDDSCAFHNDGDAEGAFDDLMESLDENPIPSVPGRPDISRGVAIGAVIDAMYADFLWPDLAQALADAQVGDGAGLLALFDDYYQRREDGTYDNSLEAFQSISCMDTPERPSIDEEDATAPRYTEVAPRLAPEGSIGGYFCTFFPATDDPRITITGDGAGPILVVGTTGDASTPLASSRIMADTLDEGVLLIVEGEHHTAYSFNSCAAATIDAYLLDPSSSTPADETECPLD